METVLGGTRPKAGIKETREAATEPPPSPPSRPGTRRRAAAPQSEGGARQGRAPAGRPLPRPRSRSAPLPRRRPQNVRGEAGSRSRGARWGPAGQPGSPGPASPPASYLRSPRTGRAGAWRGAGRGPVTGGSDWRWAAGSACPSRPWCRCSCLRGEKPGRDCRRLGISADSR